MQKKTDRRVRKTKTQLRNGLAMLMKNAFRIFRRDMKRLLRSPAAVLVMIGVCIIPSLYAWFNIAANIDPYSNTSGIKVAVANNDKDATSNDLTINAGNEIIKNLKGIVDLKLDCAGTTVCDFWCNCIDFFIKIIIQFRSLHLAGEDTQKRTAKIFRNYDCRVIFSGFDSFNSIFFIRKSPSELIIFF